MTELEQNLEDLKRRLPSAGPGDRMLIEQAIRRTERAIERAKPKEEPTEKPKPRRRK